MDSLVVFITDLCNVFHKLCLQCAFSSIIGTMYQYLA